ncbi:MAG: hypothetical protein QNJ15_06555 [Erythrobacter sp.]|nr:hypothetical protein [Erythrobacter sp.]
MSINKLRHGKSTNRQGLAIRFVGPLLALSLVACEETGGSGPGGVSEGEARALDEAAEMLDARRLPEEALPPLDGPPAEPPGQESEPGENAAELTGDNAE